MTDLIDRAYATTRLTREEERGRECHRAGCRAAIDTTRECIVCGQPFCPAHLFEDILGDPLCAQCTAIDEAADRLIERQRRVA